jgi:hypothetical protein
MNVGFSICFLMSRYLLIVNKLHNAMAGIGSNFRMESDSSMIIIWSLQKILRVLSQKKLFSDAHNRQDLLWGNRAFLEKSYVIAHSPHSLDITSM